MILDILIDQVLQAIEDTKIHPRIIWMNAVQYESLVEEVSTGMRLIEDRTNKHGFRAVRSSEPDIRFEAGNLHVADKFYVRMVADPYVESLQLMYGYADINIELAGEKVVTQQEAINHYTKKLGYESPNAMVKNLYDTTKLRRVMSGEYYIDILLSQALSARTGRSESWWKKTLQK